MANVEQGGFPAQVGRYELLVPIASGGMATVYLGQSHGIGGFERSVAVKLLHPHLRETEIRDELVEEAKLAVKIRHPHVVSVLDVGEDEGGTYLVMEFIDGDSLAGLLREARQHNPPRIPVAVALRIFLDALAGLHASHELRDDSGAPLAIVHRDFSPQNILVGTDGLARLVDFGIAKATSRSGTTRAGLVKGKFGYMSPEQARGRPVDRRTDVWAAGVVIWEVLAGRRLYQGADGDILLAITTTVPPLLSSVLHDLHPALVRAVASALMPDLRKRAATAASLAQLLEEAAQEAGAEPAKPEEVAAFVRRATAEKTQERQRAVDKIRKRRAGAVGPPPRVVPLSPKPEAVPSEPRTIVEPHAARAAALKLSPVPQPEIAVVRGGTTTLELPGASEGANETLELSLPTAPIRDQGAAPASRPELDSDDDPTVPQPSFTEPEITLVGGQEKAQPAALKAPPVQMHEPTLVSARPGLGAASPPVAVLVGVVIGLFAILLLALWLLAT